jgi:GNAT superfamily N-acetyltransferase
MTPITYREDRDLPLDPLVTLYRANAWSSAEKGAALREAMRGLHSVVTAWAEDRLVGLGNTLSDGHPVVYYPHLLVHPDFRRRGISAEILRRLRRRYEALHMQILVADGRAVGFFESKRSRVEGDKRREGAGVRSGSCRVGSFARDGSGVVGPEQPEANRLRHGGPEQ